MTRKDLFLLILIIVFGAALPAAAADVDPILLDRPSSLVFECGENLFFEVLVNPVIEYSTGGRHAENQFFFLTAELLFLEDRAWDGLDKSGFVLKHTTSKGEELYPLNYMMTMMLGLKNRWKTISDPLVFGDLLKMTLVFDVQTLDRNGWSLLLNLAERGRTPVCEVEVPLTMQR